MGKIKIRWVRSPIGHGQDQRRTVRALGLRRLHHEVEHEDSPTIRGMVHKVRHMVHVEPVEAEAPAPAQRARHAAAEEAPEASGGA